MRESPIHHLGNGLMLIGGVDLDQATENNDLFDDCGKALHHEGFLHNSSQVGLFFLDFYWPAKQG
jgi:hypothetical protein